MVGRWRGKFTIPTQHAHRTKREKQMIKKTDQTKKGRWEMGFLYGQVKRRKEVKETFRNGDLFHFVYSAIKGERERERGGGVASLVKILFIAKISLNHFIFCLPHYTSGCISSLQCIILLDKCVNLKLGWMKNYDTKPKKKNSLYTCKNMLFLNHTIFFHWICIFLSLWSHMGVFK